jgi:tetratricopeptide (TPR) repeat protein
MNLSPRRPIFNRRAESSVYRMFFWAILALGGIWLIIQMRHGDIKSPFQPTPTPTRTSNSFALEGDAQFTAGSLDKSISAYQEAVRVDPNNAVSWAKLARIQTYSTTLLTIDADKEARLQAALQSSTQAVTLAPDDSTAHAVHAFVLDWNANSTLVDNNQVQNYLTQADQEAVHALQLDGTNTLALAYYAEILVDEQKWTQAQGNIQQAVDRDPSLMDVHRVYAYVLESLGQYNLAIQEYDKALAIAPNLTFLYMAAGANYRQLGFRSPNPETQKQLYDSSLVYFAKAASINAQLGVNDPVPYLSIAKTYSQEGEFFIAARNVQKALQFKPDNPDIYGQLGIIYFKSRNYEGSIPALQCAVVGCSGDTSCQGRGLSACDALDPPIVVNSLPLSPNTVDYYQVYFSVLAALGPRDPTYCPRAMSVADQVQTSGLISARPDIAGNMAVAQQECSTSPETATPAPVTAGSLYISTSTAFPTVTPSIAPTP